VGRPVIRISDDQNLVKGPTLGMGSVLPSCAEDTGITNVNEFGTDNGPRKALVVRFEKAQNKRIRVKCLRDRHSICKRYGKINDDTTAMGAFIVVTYNTYPEDLKTNLNITKIISQDH